MESKDLARSLSLAAAAGGAAALTYYGLTKTDIFSSVLSTKKGRDRLSSKGKPFRWYMGYDSHEDIAFEVARYSLMRRSSVPVEVIPLKRREFVKRGIYTRSQDPKQSTEFTYLRFLVPYLNNYNGWAAFSDDDILFLGDIGTLIDQIDDKYAVMCVQHDYKPSITTKLAGKAQSVYPRKNWSSVVLFNCGHPANRCLDLEMINRESGSYLHRFSWIKDDRLIGAIDYTWNFLVEWHKPLDSGIPNLVHYTEGGPWFPDYRNVDYSKQWFDELNAYEATLPTKRVLCPYELFTTSNSKPLPGYPNSDEKWDWSMDDEWQKSKDNLRPGLAN